MQHQPWASGKSIDDLEATMSSRWGTLDDSSTSMAGGIPEGFEIFSGDEDDFETMDDYDVHYDDSSPPKKGNKNKNNMSGSDRWRKPVLDPWDEEEASSKKQRNNKFFGEREYYDQDDEGYEILGEMEDDDGDEFLEIDESISSPYLPRVDHLIAPKPAGGRGSNRNSNKNDGGGGYFFNPDVVNSRKKEDAPLFRKERKRDVSEPNSVAPESEEDIRTNKARKRRQSAKPLLNKNGQQRLLTIEEAFNQFQESVDEGMMEIIETAEVPILAKHANAKSWDDVGITSTTMLENLRYDMNCPNPLAVQEKTTPAILTGSDVLVGTYTGSGKTLSFLVPLVQRLLWSIDEDSDGNIINDPGLAVLIVVPGRELASQIVSVARDLLQDTGLSALRDALRN
ncbi:unnamed protein product [Pseudo-nitzschia multistriata]|uniref:ATP-dependent RNA helicase n=1 Tax=Pseudo-nitzschia multistriata TaxID=183589 RepID=A0A448ZMP9_9STRA|nr:unnamed protein product [Pseudo-nitzschia multistriata]